VDIGSITQRKTQATPSFGGVVGPPNLQVRTIGVEGLMFASTEGGMTYGERWMADALSGLCESSDYQGEYVRMLLQCNVTGFRKLVHAGIVDGPHFSPEGAIPPCCMHKFQFQIAGGNPRLLKDPVDLLPWTYLKPGVVKQVLLTSDQR